MQSSSGSPRTKAPRPWSVTFLVVGVLILSAFYFTRALTILADFDFWQEMFLPGSPLYLLASGLFWGLLWLLAGIALWLGRPRVLRWWRFLFAVFLLFAWTERIIAGILSGDTGGWLFWLLFTLALVALVAWILSRSGARRFLGDEGHD